MKRRLFNVAAALSLVLCVAACVLWVRSEGVRPDAYQRESRPKKDSGRYQRLLSHRGVLFLVTHEVTLTPNARVNLALPTGTVTPWKSWWAGKATPRNFPSREYFGLPEADRPWEQLGVYVRWTQVASRGNLADRVRTVGVPYWLIACLTAAPSALWLRSLCRERRAVRRRRKGLCATCGYDVRSHKGGERCPECGTAVEPANPAA